MNLFTFIAHGRNGRIYNGVFKATDGTDARRVLPNLLQSEGIDALDFDFHGVQHTTFDCHSHISEESVFLNMLNNSGMVKAPDCCTMVHTLDYTRCLADHYQSHDRKRVEADQSHDVTIGSGHGYAGFVASFHFDQTGKLVSHGVFE